MNEETSDFLIDTLDVIENHSSHLRKLDKTSKDSDVKLDLFTKELEKQIEASSKDVLLKLLEQNSSNKEQLIKDISTVIATNIAKLSITAGDITVNVETDSIAKVISKLPINNTNNIVIDTVELVKDNKQFLTSLQAINNNLTGNLTAIKVIFQEMVEQNKVKKIEEAKELKVVKEEETPVPRITKMTVRRDKDNLIESIDFG